MKKKTAGGTVEFDIEKDGITQGLILRKWECPEKARYFLRRLERIGTKETLPIAFGNVAHNLLQRIYTAFGEAGAKRAEVVSERSIERFVQVIEQEWMDDNPRASAEELRVQATATGMARALVPKYFKYWSRDLSANWIHVEEKFAIPYVLEDGRKTVLRGAMDAGFTEKTPKGTRVVLLETKTKSRIDPIFLEDWLPFDVQTSLYTWAMIRKSGRNPNKVLYNIIRRPQLRLKNGETTEQFAARCLSDIDERPDFYFVRVPLEITKTMLNTFEVRLESIVRDIYDWWQGRTAHYRNSGACENKYGTCAFFEACAGRMDIYRTRKHIYRELEE